jgi:hypothetical protein
MTQRLETPITKQQVRALFVKEQNPWNHEEISEDQARKLFNALYASSVTARPKRKSSKYY